MNFASNSESATQPFNLNPLCPTPMGLTNNPSSPPNPSSSCLFTPLTPSTFSPSNFQTPLHYNPPLGNISHPLRQVSPNSAPFLTNVPTTVNPNMFSYSPDEGFLPSQNIYPGVFAFQSETGSPTSFVPPSIPSCSFSSLPVLQDVRPAETFFNELGTSNKTTDKLVGCKRKLSSPLPPYKQHITEKRMIEHMSKLHISSETPTSSEEPPPIRERRLYMCDEMRRLQSDSIIPVQLLSKVNRPCTALVPWTPPIVPFESKENNNNEDEPDNNSEGSMDMDS